MNRQLSHLFRIILFALLAAFGARALIVMFSLRSVDTEFSVVDSSFSLAPIPSPPSELQFEPIAPQKYVNGGARVRSSMPGGLSADEWQRIRGQIEESEYAFELSDGRALAANREQRIKTSVGQAGVEVSPYARPGELPAWSWQLRWMGTGAEAAKVSASGRRAEIGRGSVTEWYENRTVGVEQGFTIHEAPAASADGEDRLRLRFECETSLAFGTPGVTGLEWKDASGAVVLRYNGLRAYDANAMPVPAEFECSPEAPEQITIALNTRGAVYPLTVDPLIATLPQQLQPAVPTELQFGFAVAMQGDVCVIGSPPDDPDKIHPTPGLGAVYLYYRNPAGFWTQARRLLEPVSNSNRAFGAALALSGNTLVIGTPAFTDPTAPLPANAVGAYIYRFEPGTLFQTIVGSTALLDPAGTSRTSEFGRAVALSSTGASVAVGSPGASSGGAQTGGRVLIYRRNPDGSYPTASSALHDSWGGQADAEWGRSLAFDRLADERLAVGAPGYDQTGLLNAGRAAIVEVTGAGVSILPVTPASPGYEGDARFGSSVALYGDDLAVGHPDRSAFVLDPDGTTRTVAFAGTVHLFSAATGWNQSRVIASPGATGFGLRVSLDGENLVVDSFTYSYGYARQYPDWVRTFTYPDALYLPRPQNSLVVSGDHVLFGDSGEIFQLHGNGWSTIDPGLSVVSGGERLGMALAGAPEFTVVGAPFYSVIGSTHRGYVAVVTYSSSGRPQFTPLGSGAPGGSELGTTVATDGKRIAAGAPGFDSNSGFVSIYQRDGSGVWGEVGGVPNPDTVSPAGDRFGSAIALDGDRLVVGAALDGHYGFWGGRAWVFQRDAAGVWGSPEELVPVGGLGPFDLFGWSVDIEGDRIVVGEPGDDTAGSGTGAVHVFERRGGGWQWRAKTTPNPGEVPVGVEVNLGFSVALDGDLIAAGAPALVISPGSGPGSVSVFARMAGGMDHWGQLARFVPGDSANDDEFGLSVLWHDDELFVGTGQTDAIFVLRSGNGAESWSEAARIANPTPATDLGFGHSFAITRNILATGIPLANSEAGQVVYFRRPLGWYPAPVYDGIDTNGLGSALAIDGDTAALGADRYTVPGAPGSEHGGVYVLTRNAGGEWMADPNVLIADPVLAGARFGAAVALDRDHLIVGAPFHNGSGAAWDFTRLHDGQWSRNAIPGGGGQFGASVSIDGRVAAIGAPFSSPYGSAFVYLFDIGTFGAFLEKTLLPPTLPVQNPTLGEVRFGASVSLDGETLAIGAPGVDLAAGPDRGNVFVYERNLGGARQWGMAKSLDGLPSEISAGFGESLDLCGNRLLIGAPGHIPGAPVAAGATGAAYLLRYDQGGPGNWGREQILLPRELQDGERFGHAVALDGEWIAVGAPGRKAMNGTPTGAVETFLLGADTTSPAETGIQLAYAGFTRFGSSLALGGNTLLVGDDMTFPGSSSVEVFALMNHRERWGYDNFNALVFEPALEATIWGDLADRDHDGLPTLLEYLMGSSPTRAEPAPYETTVVSGMSPGLKFLRLRYRKARWPSRADYVLEPQWSFDLANWFRSGEGPTPLTVKIIEQVVSEDGYPYDSWLIDAYLNVSAGEPRAYLRLVATKR